jgi:hypothetical protein
MCHYDDPIGSTTSTVTTLRWMVLLSLVSVACQWTMMGHLRTTAPHQQNSNKKSKRARNDNNEHEHLSSSQQQRQHKNRLAYVYRILHLKHGSNVNVTSNPTHRHSRSPTRTRHGRTMLTRDCEFELLSELQHIFDAARLQWTAKLEHVLEKTHKHHNHQGGH